MTAYYMAQNDGMDLSSYDFVVGNMDLDPEELRERCAPGATIGAYFSPLGVLAPRTDGKPRGGLHGWEFDQYQFKNPAATFWLDENDKPRFVFPPTLWGLRFGRDVVAIKVALAYKIAQKSWDFIYLDDFQTPLAESYIQRLMPGATPAQIRAIQVHYNGMLNGLVYEIRQTCPAYMMIVANVHDARHNVVRRSALQGICMEEHWPSRRPMFLSEVVTRYRPSLCVAWEWDPGFNAHWGYIRYRHEAAAGASSSESPAE